MFKEHISTSIKRSATGLFLLLSCIESLAFGIVYLSRFVHIEHLLAWYHASDEMKQQRWDALVEYLKERWDYLVLVLVIAIVAIAIIVFLNRLFCLLIAAVGDHLDKLDAIAHAVKTSSTVQKAEQKPQPKTPDKEEFHPTPLRHPKLDPARFDPPYTKIEPQKPSEATVQKSSNEDPSESEDQDTDTGSEGSTDSTIDDKE